MVGSYDLAGGRIEMGKDLALIEERVVSGGRREREVCEHGRD